MKLKASLSVALVAALAIGCSTNPFTGQQTLALVPNSQILPMAFQQYSEFLSENKVVKNTSDSKMVQNVGQKIASAAERYLNANGYQGYLNDYKWEYNLVDSKEINAWCMPGGKIVVYSGILPITKNEAGLAAVMGHEVAHALANHGQQRMSAGQLQQLGEVAGNIALSKNPENQQIFNSVYGLGTSVGVMAIAGYEPLAAADLWQRMQAQEQGSPPEFLSTHPASTTRIENIKAAAASAREEAKKFGVTNFKR